MSINNQLDNLLESWVVSGGTSSRTHYIIYKQISK